MRVLIFDSREATEKAAAARLIKQVNKNSRAVLGLATGGTVVPIYRAVVNAFQRSEVSFAEVTTFNLDEYAGLSPEHPQSYRQFMQTQLFDHIDIQRQRTHIPIGNTNNAKLEAVRFESQIKTAGGIDWQLLGIGENGHIGFNEPTSSLNSRTRVKPLSKSTIAANSRFFSDDETVPETAITMGIGTILDSRKVILVATGKKKAHAVATMIEGGVSAICPASALQLHPRATILLDPEAASELTLMDYYQRVEADN